MKLIANLNGVNVYSDKVVEVIVNGKIMFADGSICIPATKTIINQGKGSITFDVETAKTLAKEETRVVEKEFDVSKVKIIDLAANVRVIPYGERSIKVIIKGPEAAIKTIKAFKEEDWAVVTGGDQDGFSRSGVRGTTTTIMGQVNGSVFSGDFNGAVIMPAGSVSQHFGDTIVMASRGGIGAKGKMRDNVFITNNNNVIGNRAGDGVIPGDEVLVEVHVPLKTYIWMVGVSGRAEIGDTLGDVRLSANGYNEITCGAVGNVRALAKDYGQIQMASVTGDAILTATQHAEVVVSGGNINELSANTDGYSQMFVKGVVQIADLEAAGYSQISVANVVEYPIMLADRHSTVIVGNWGV